MNKLLLTLLLAASSLANAWEQRPPLPVQACQVHSPNGCRTYPQVRHIQNDILSIPGCGYYLEEDLES